MNRNIPVSPFLEHFAKPQKSPHTPIISAKMEALLIQYNAIAKVFRTKKFKELEHTNYEAWCERIEIYGAEQDKLDVKIDNLRASVTGTLYLWDGAV